VWNWKCAIEKSKSTIPCVSSGLDFGQQHVGRWPSPTSGSGRNHRGCQKGHPLPSSRFGAAAHVVVSRRRSLGVRYIGAMACMRAPEYSRSRTKLLMKNEATQWRTKVKLPVSSAESVCSLQQLRSMPFVQGLRSWEMSVGVWRHQQIGTALWFQVRR
jgi:hypothetical protein